MRKIAFVFSASEYIPSSVSSSRDNLPGVKNDVVAISKRLKQIGFDVKVKENATKNEYSNTISSEIHNLPNDAVSIVYFSGHGGHCDGENYIFPSDFGLLFDKTNSIEDAFINVKDLISLFKDKGRLIIILDSCRKPICTSKPYYSEMASGRDVYIAYGTMFEDSSIATSNLSWFTKAICDEILTPNISVDTLFTLVRNNIFRNHKIQIPASVNGLTDEVMLHTELEYDFEDKKVYDFIQKYGDEYTDKYGYFHGDDLIFIDASQYFNIGLLDAIYMFKKVDDKIYKDKGVPVPELSESEAKIVRLLSFTQGDKYFKCDPLTHTWYYNGRQIRMGEIPPLPPSMQRKLPEKGMELDVSFDVNIEDDGSVSINTNLPENSELFIDINGMGSIKVKVENGRIYIDQIKPIEKIEINESCVFNSDPSAKSLLGDKCCNLIGDYVKYHPIFGNQILFIWNKNI